MTKYNVGVQCFPEKKDRQMAMVLTTRKPTQGAFQPGWQVDRAGCLHDGAHGALR